MADILYIVVPCYNEEEVLPETSRRLRAKLEGLMAAGKISERSRVLFVNDGSRDRTWELITRLHGECPLFCGADLSRNRGHQNALLAGLMTAKERCDMAISMDADLQDDIDAVDAMVEQYYAGCDVVYGVRSSRKKDTFFKRFTAEGFYRVMNFMGAETVFNHADYRLMSRRALEGLAQFREVNLFLRGIVPMIGYRTGTVEYERGERKRERLFQAFLTDPDAVNEERLLHAVSRQERESLRLLAAVLREYRLKLGNLSEAVQDYEEYVEGWAHEAKTPLSLLTMILDNRADEIPLDLHTRLDYVRGQLQEDITQMLYYARLKSTTKDYLFEDVPLQEILEEVLEDYAPLLEEKRFSVQNQVGTEIVFTDRRGLRFMLGQIIGNAVKYSGETPVLTLSLAHTAGETILSVTDNGVGVKAHDLPYIFQKGFTGDSAAHRKKATGMGLYLTQRMADDLKLKLEAESEYGRYFRMAIRFPALTLERTSASKSAE